MIGFNVLTKVILAAALCLSATPGLAKVTVYNCDIKGQSNSGWVPEKVVIALDSESGDILVNDPIINHFNDELPLPAKVVVKNAKRTTFSWSLRGVKNRSGQYAPKFSYRATYYNANKTMVVTAKPLGYTNTFQGRGTCKILSK